MKAKPKKRKSAPKKDNTGSCHRCDEPLEFWGVSTEYRLFRCTKCGVIHHMEWGKPLYPPGRGTDLRCGEGWIAA